LYNEISSYYKDRSNNNEQTWNLIYPLGKKYCYTRINSALSLRYAIPKMANANITVHLVLA